MAEIVKNAKEQVTKAVDNDTGNAASAEIRNLAKNLTGELQNLNTTAAHLELAGKAQIKNSIKTGADPKKAGDPNTDELSAQESVTKDTDKSTWEKVLDIVQKVVDFICKYKAKIKGYFTKELETLKLRRVFFQRRTYRALKVSSLGFWDDATGFFAKIGDSLEKGWKQVKDIGAWIYKKIKGHIPEALTWSKKIIKNKFILNVIDVLECFTKLNVPSAIQTTVNGLKNRINDISSVKPKKIASVFIDLVCNMGLFREAFALLAEVISEKAPLIKWNKFGRFVGKFLYALGN